MYVCVLKVPIKTEISIGCLVVIKVNNGDKNEFKRFG